MKCYRAIAFAAGLMLVLTKFATAQDLNPQPPFSFLPTDRAVNGPGTFSFSGSSLIIGYEKLQPGSFNTFLNESSPTITFNDGSTSLGRHFIYNGSTLLAHQTTLGNVYAYNEGKLISDNNGAIGQVWLHQNSNFILNSGTAALVSATNFSKLTMSGGQIGTPDHPNDLATASHATASVSGGHIYGAANARDQSSIDLVSTTIAGSLNADGNGARATATSANIGSASASNNSEVDLQSTEVKSGVSVSAGLMNINDTNIGGALTAADGTILMARGSFDGGASAFLDSGIDVTNAIIKGSLLARDTAHLTLSDCNAAVRGPAAVYDNATLSLVETSAASADAFGQGTMILNQASISQDANAHNASQLDVMFGSHIVGSAAAADQSTLNVHSGTFIDGNLTSAGFASAVSFPATVTMTGGSVQGDVRAALEGSVFLTGGSVSGGATATDLSILSMSGGIVFANLTADVAGTVNLAGGSIAGDLVVHDEATAYMTGGYVAGTLNLSGTATFNYSGGRFGLNPPPPPPGGGSLSPQTQSVTGQGFDGMFNDGLVGHDGSTINILGHDLVAVLVDPNFPDPNPFDPDFINTFSVYQLSGFLADGSPLVGQYLYIQNQTGASFSLAEVPEPSAAALAFIAGLGCIYLRGAERKRAAGCRQD